MNCKALLKIKKQCTNTDRKCENCKDMYLRRMCLMFTNCRQINAYRCRNTKCPYHKDFKGVVSFQ